MFFFSKYSLYPNIRCDTKYVPKLALASLMAEADGIIYEVHEKPEEAL